MVDEKNLSEMEKLFAALADKTRLRLLNLIREDEVCVCFFVEALNESQPKISRHLAYLRKNEIVSARREGKWMHYKINFPANVYAREILDNTLEWLKSQDEMQLDYERLMDACCSVEVPVTISKAPKPDILPKANMKKQEKEELETFLL